MVNIEKYLNLVLLHKYFRLRFGLVNSINLYFMVKIRAMANF